MRWPAPAPGQPRPRRRPVGRPEPPADAPEAVGPQQRRLHPAPQAYRGLDPRVSPPLQRHDRFRRTRPRERVSQLQSHERPSACRASNQIESPTDWNRVPASRAAGQPGGPTGVYPPQYHRVRQVQDNPGPVAYQPGLLPIGTTAGFAVHGRPPSRSVRPRRFPRGRGIAGPSAGGPVAWPRPRPRSCRRCPPAERASDPSRRKSKTAPCDQWRNGPTAPRRVGLWDLRPRRRPAAWVPTAVPSVDQSCDPPKQKTRSPTRTSLGDPVMEPSTSRSTIPPCLDFDAPKPVGRPGPGPDKKTI